MENIDSVEELLDFTKTGKGKSTFMNIGNTCYLNSALQVLMHIEEIRKIFIKTEKMIAQNPEVFKNRDIKFYDCIKAIYKGYWEDDCLIRPLGLVKYLDEHSYFPMGQQCDSTEVLTCIIQKIHESVAIPKELSVENATSSLEEMAIQQWNIYLDKKYSPLSNMFWGQFYNRVHCHHCSNKTQRFETFHYLTLQAVIDGEENVEGDIDLIKFLEHFLVEKKFDNENRYHCEICSKKVEMATTRTSLWKLPKYLIIQLKRYYNKTDSKQLYKSHRSIEYPVSFDPSFLLDKKKSSKIESQLAYNLHSGVFHAGSLNGGHYNCFSWNQDTLQWIGFDDERKVDLEEPIIKHSNIYQLVYQLNQTKD